MLRSLPPVDKSHRVMLSALAGAEEAPLYVA
jgi:hypothetical protein